MSRELNTEAAGLSAQHKTPGGAELSINDLRQKGAGGEKLNHQEKQALAAFYKYRIAILNRQQSEDAFHNKYLELQIMSNLTPYEEFLKEGYLVL